MGFASGWPAGWLAERILCLPNWATFWEKITIKNGDLPVRLTNAPKYGKPDWIWIFDISQMCVYIFGEARALRVQKR